MPAAASKTSAPPARTFLVLGSQARRREPACGFLGIGEKHWPLPWSALNYDTAKEGFIVDIDKKRLEDAPSYDEDDFAWTPDYGRTVDKYYNAPSYWS